MENIEEGVFEFLQIINWVLPCDIVSRFTAVCETNGFYFAVELPMKRENGLMQWPRNVDSSNRIVMTVWNSQLQLDNLPGSLRRDNNVVDLRSNLEVRTQLS